ncbi:MAG TPA: aminotransferase class V-fold PLP-dependent enzyme [Gemmatimonadaceae bacterium]|nr:aminotransferase class V-fold PLP-dependent enzyme [Gemmatimonadaceae bacterium]
MAGRHFLFVPGPTNVPDRVLRAMARPMVDHRSSAFPALTTGLLRDLRPVFGTTAGQPVIFAATGTGGWEVALVNACRPGDRLLAVRNGQFSHLFVDAAQRLGFDVETIDVPWGEGVPADAIEQRLRADGGAAIRAVLVVHNETATGVTSDIGAVRAAIDAAGHPALLFVDGVSSVGSIPFRFDDWRVDAAIAGSQKGLMLPPGLGIVCLSERALGAALEPGGARGFFDLRPMLQANADGYFPYTPALSLLFGLREALDMFAEEGLPNVFARHARLASGVRAAVAEWGLALCAARPELESNTVSAVVVPDGADARRVIDLAFRRYDLSLGGGLGRLAGRVFRIGHLGDVNELMLLGALAGVEMSLADAGIDVTLGSGVAAAQRLWRRSYGATDGAIESAAITAGAS